MTNGEGATGGVVSLNCLDDFDRNHPDIVAAPKRGTRCSEIPEEICGFWQQIRLF
jgi:hypothetical protein